MAKRKRKVRIRMRESVSLVHKGDATRVSRPDTARLRRAPTFVPNNGAVFRVKLRRKNG